MEREGQTEQSASRLLIDETYAYRGYDNDGGTMRLRIFERPAASPLAIATELPQNTNTLITKITNMAEYLAWEVGSRLLGGRFEVEPPCDWVEHYPGEPASTIRHRREDA